MLPTMSPLDSPPAYLSPHSSFYDDEDDEQDLIEVEALATVAVEDEDQDLSPATSGVTSRVPFAIPVVLRNASRTEASSLEDSFDPSSQSKASTFLFETSETTPEPPSADAQAEPATSFTPPMGSQVLPSTGLPNVTTPVRKGCQDTIDSFINAQDTQSPSKNVNTDAIREQDMGSVLETREVLLKELAGKIAQVDLSWAENLYKDISRAREAKVRGFLRTTNQYRDGRWVKLPKAPKGEKSLYNPLAEIINSILRWANLSTTRKAIDTHAGYLKHSGQEPTSHRSSPDIAVKGMGPSFTCPTDNREVGFSNMVSFFDAKRDQDVRGNGDNHVGQLGVYARQCFIQQPNRRYVRCMIITERQARFYHFDRSGVQYTKLFDIHEDAKLFVLLVVGLCTNDESLVGLDESVQWTVGGDGVRTGGTLTTVGPNKTPITYTLSMDEVPWVRTNVLGRGIVCWSVQDERGEGLIVKDYWMSEGRRPEYEILELVKGNLGLCQIVSYEVGVFHNAIAIRIIMKIDSKRSIDKFTSLEELVAALRDAIAAHQIMVSNGLFHRDISHHAVLIGSRGISSRIGERGILIHLDMAIGPVRTVTEFCQDVKSRIPLYQSWIMLKAYSMPESLVVAPAHDYLDDLEAFFWLFCYLVFSYNPDGGHVSELRKIGLEWIEGWKSHSRALNYKQSFLSSGTLRTEARATMYPGWGDLCVDLLVDLRDVMAEFSKAKEYSLFRTQGPGSVTNRFSEILRDVNGNYARVITLFDNALEKLRAANAPINDPLNAAPTDTDPIEELEPIDEVSEASGSNKRRAREPDTDSENEEVSNRQKRACLSYSDDDANDQDS
ncbi:hypothetical protein MD484_g3477, partial [Candolleomyces efflorescens]